MKITEIHIELVKNYKERLRAFCSIVLDDVLIIYDLKIIQGDKSMFVAMPSRKITDHCPNCGCKNHLRAFFCNKCGGQLDNNRVTCDANGQTKLYTDIAHPINSVYRESIQDSILEAYEKEKNRSREPGYIFRHNGHCV